MITLQGSNGLFPRLASIATASRTSNTYRGTTVPGLVSAIASAYAGDPADIDGIFGRFGQYPTASASILSYLQGIAKATLIDMVNADTPLPVSNLKYAMAALCSQMAAAGQSVAASTGLALAITPNPGNTGNPVLVASLRGVTGLAIDNAFAEVLTATVTADSQSGRATAGSEPLSVVGASSVAALDSAWPAGSGATAGLRLIDASRAGSSGASFLNGGDFETWTAGLPASWNLRAGVAANLAQSTPAYTNAAALGFVGDGASTPAIDQVFGTNNPVLLLPSSQYAVNFWAAATGSPATGSLEVALVDGSGNITVDGQGVANALVVPAASLAATYAPFGAVFRTPRVLPTQLRLRVRLLAPLPSGTTLLLDRIGFAVMAPLYPGGPYLAGFSGSVPVVLGDGFGLTVANSRGTTQQAFEQLYGMRALGLVLPTSATPTIPGF